MLERRHHTRLVAERGVALKATHGGDAHSRAEIRVFAEGLLHTSPPWVTGNVHHRRERLVNAPRARLERRHRVEALDERGIEGRTERDGLRKARAAYRRMAVQTLVMKHDRDAQPALLAEEPLNVIRELGLLARIASLLRFVSSAARVARAADLPQSIAMAEGGARLRDVERTVRVHEGVGLLLPDARHLRRLFLDGHARQQILDPPFRRKCSVLKWVHPRRLSIPGSEDTSDRQRRRRSAIAEPGAGGASPEDSASTSGCTSPLGSGRSSHRVA